MAAKHRVLILGGGFGGVATAHALRARLPEDWEILVVDRRDQFMVGFRKTWSLFGLGSASAGTRSLHSLHGHGIGFLKGSIDRIDPAGRLVEVEGVPYQGDAVVVALGAELDAGSLPGFETFALDVYSSAAIPAAAERLRSFRGGKVLIGIFGEPYKCPPAPYEMAFLAREAFERWGAGAEIEVFTPKPVSLPILGETGCEVIESRLAASGIRFLPNHTAVGVREGWVTFTTGRRPYDLLLGVAPHRCPEVVVEAGLAAPGGWVQVDARTLETPFEHIYAIGDVTSITLANGKPLPKAGIFAEGQGQVVADRIAARVQGLEPDAGYEGDGYCFLEVGGGEAMLVEGKFLDEPAPDVTLSEPSVENLERKREFESERLEGWFDRPSGG